MSPFWRKGSSFANMLERLALPTADLIGRPFFEEAIVARNYLLDERLPPDRAEQYEAVIEEAAPDYPALEALAEDKYSEEAYRAVVDRHFDYFRAHVGIVDDWPYGPQGPLGRLAEHHTFRDPVATDTYGASDPDLYLLRVEKLSHLAVMGRRPDARQVIERYLRDPSSSAASKEVDDMLRTIYHACDLRPVFAMFEGDVGDGLDMASNWADRLRDWAGLRHLSSPGPIGTELPVVLFRYQVRDVPKFQGEARFPLAIPTVLDGSDQPNAAYCPSPVPAAGGQQTGCTVCLDQDDRLVREILHPSFPFRADHITAIGSITTQPSLDLAGGRSHHILKVRIACDRGDFGTMTEGV